MDEEIKQQSTNTTTNWAVPVAIVIAGALVAGAFIYTSDNRGSVSQAEKTNQPAQDGEALDLMDPITEKDHILGNPDAKVFIVEYSDYECPFCKRFHVTMNQIMNEYGESGQVAWVYRHFPLDQLHPVKARAEAVAAECAEELAGPNAFWQFSDRFFELTPSNNQTDIETVIPQIITELGISEKDFVQCANSGRYDEHIQAEVDNAILTGGRGTPWSILITSNGEKFPINGAQPYSSIKQLIDLALQNQ